MRIAKEDIVAHKIMIMSTGYITLLSPYLSYRYEEGKIYEVKLKPIPTGHPEFEYVRIDEGLHCYSTECPYDVTADAKAKEVTNTLTMYSKRNNKQLSSFLKIWSNTRQTDMYPVLMKVIIPAGATYYENKCGEIVTNKLIIKERIA
jgi:hypothetical protein